MSQSQTHSSISALHPLSQPLVATFKTLNISFGYSKVLAPSYPSNLPSASLFRMCGNLKTAYTNCFCSTIGRFTCSLQDCTYRGVTALYEFPRMELVSSGKCPGCQRSVSLPERPAPNPTKRRDDGKNSGRKK